VPVRLRAGHRSYLTSVIGLPTDSQLRRPHNAALRPIDVPSGQSEKFWRQQSRLSKN
jgi:putative ABC transport system permease protein